MSNAAIRGRFVWHELMTSDKDGAIDFYSHIVPWKTRDSGMPSYTLWTSGEHQAGGLMALPEDGFSGTPAHWLVYIGTPDVDATIAAAKKLGGKVLKAAANIPNVGRFAVLSDAQGAAFAVYTSYPSSDVSSPSGGVGDFTWHDLATTDVDAAFAFYSELFGWAKGAAHNMGEMGVYQIISVAGQDTAGIYKARDESTPPNWLSYARVADAAKVTNAVSANGGRVLNGPMEVPGGSWILQLLDPQGGAFGVVEAPNATASQIGKHAQTKRTVVRTPRATAAERPKKSSVGHDQTKKQSRIFISYARADKAFATHLAEDLRRVGIPVWIDQLDIPVGTPWDDQIEEALTVCRSMLVVLSPRSAKSRNVKDEVAHALDRGNQLFPVLLEPCEIPFRLARLQYVDFADNYEVGLERLIAQLRR